MMKKSLALLLVLALALGALALTATAANTDEVDYRVGYAKVDLNPYWSVWEATGNEIPDQAVTSTGEAVTSDHMMPLPMGGYGGNTHRLSRPELVDDNGSGVHNASHVYLDNNRYTREFAAEMGVTYSDGAYGQNDGDGIYGTCVSIRQNEAAEPILYFSVDFIGMSDSYCGQAKSVIIRELKKMGVDIAPDRILINATHTHGSVSLGEDFTDGTTYVQKLYTYHTDGASASFLGSVLDSYLSAYRTHIYNQLAAAAVKALTDGQNSGEVTMEKGTIDVSDATGYQLNGVRHRKAQLTTTVDGTSQTVDYVTGSSFNVDLDGETEISGVSESNDKLHVLQFSFDGAQPILMINWRAHTTANNKMYSAGNKLGTKTHNNLSADFVAAMRYQLEQWGYRPILSYGASGNLGMGDEPNTFNISTAATATTMNGTKYGYTLALAAAYLADGTANSAVKTAYNENRAAIETKQRSAASSRATAEANATTQETQAADYQTKADNAYFSYLKNYYQGKADECLATAAQYRAQAAQYSEEEQVWTAVLDAMQGAATGMTACTQGEILLESAWYDVKAQISTDAGYEAALYHNALAVDEGGSDSNDGGLKLEKTGYPFVVKAGTYTANGSAFTVSGDFVIASQYHAKGLINHHGTVNAKRIGLSAFTLGDQVAFVTMPFEASDRYSKDATLATANDYNDWDELVNDSKWGTPFVVSLTNGAEGYFPNNLAYTYDQDLEAKTIAGTIGQAFVSGSYEAHTAYAKAGEGENIVAELNTLLRNLGNTAALATKTGWCEACKADATWAPLDNATAEAVGNYLIGGHYYLAGDFTNIYGQLVVDQRETVCLELNGHTYYANTNTGASRAFTIYGTLNVQDRVGGGVIKGKMASGKLGGTINVTDPGVLNLFSGTITCNTTGDGTVQDGGNIYVGAGGTFNMYGGTVTGGKATRYGGNISLQHTGELGAVMNMYGGTVTGGSAGSENYANMMVSGKSTLRYAGGYIPTGVFAQGSLLLGSEAACEINANVTALAIKNNGTVTLDGIFTGNVILDYSDSNVYKTNISVGGVIGEVNDGARIDHKKGNIAINNSDVAGYEGIVSGTKLIIGEQPPLPIATVNGVEYTDINAALAASSGKYPAVLLDSVAGIALTRDAYMELNGCNATGVTAGAYKLYVTDSATDDYDVQDGVYGRLTNVTGEVLAADGYMAITENEGVSFHKFVMEMTSLVVNPGKVGISYKANFQGDQIVKAQVMEFGVAVRAYHVPDENSIWLDTGKLTHMALKQSAWQTGKTENSVKSVYVRDILDNTVTDDINNARADVPIYTLAYIKLRDGTMLFSDSFNFSLKTAMAHMDDYWASLGETNQTNLAKFYNDHKTVMQDWPNIGNIRQKAAALEGAQSGIDIPV